MDFLAQFSIEEVGKIYEKQRIISDLIMGIFQALLDVLQQEMPELAEAAATMTQQQRENWLQQISMKMNALDPGMKILEKSCDHENASNLCFFAQMTTFTWASSQSEVFLLHFVPSTADKEARHNLLVEAAVFKVVNRQKYLELSQEETVKKDDVIVSLLADLQQEQDQESEKLVNEMQDKVFDVCLMV